MVSKNIWGNTTEPWFILGKTQMSSCTHFEEVCLTLLKQDRHHLAPTAQLRDLCYHIEN